MKYFVYMYCILLSGCLSGNIKYEDISDAAEIDSEEALKSYAKYVNNNYYKLRDNLNLLKYPHEAYHGLDIRMRGIEFDVKCNYIQVEYEMRTGVIVYISMINKKDVFP